MIKVTIISDKRVVESVYPNPSSDIRIAWAQEEAFSPGYCVFSESGELIKVKDDDNVFELLIRASLNHLDLNAVETAFSTNEEMLKGLLLLGFKNNSGRAEVNIKSFFKPCGGCAGQAKK